MNNEIINPEVTRTIINMIIIIVVLRLILTHQMLTTNLNLNKKIKKLNKIFQIA